MGRADDRGDRATTRVRPAPRVTLDWRATPFTCRGKEDTKWKREKTGRWVLRTSNGHGKTTYWRAPRPRPRLHRRQRRRLKQEVVDEAMARDHRRPQSLEEAHTVIQVLQDAMQASIAKELAMRAKLQAVENALVESQAKATRHATELDRLVPQQPGDALLERNENAESGFVGVSRNRGRWAAHTPRNGGVREHIGTFDTPVEAARALQDRLAATAAATVEASPAGLRWPSWFPRANVGIFWSLVVVTLLCIGIPWYLIPLGLLLVYGLLYVVVMCILEPPHGQC